MRLDQITEAATPKQPKTKGVAQSPNKQARNSDSDMFNELELHVGSDVRIDFPITNCLFGQYLSSCLFYGTLVKVDNAKKFLVAEIDEMVFNDETVAGGPVGQVNKKKMAFYFDDIVSVDVNRNTVEIEMNRK